VSPVFEVDVKVDLRGLLSLAPGIDRRAGPALMGSGRRIRGAARQYAPRRTGFMADNIELERVASPAAEQMIRVYGGASYTVYQEARVHFMDQALRENEGTVFTDAQRAVFAAVDEANR
jgi:hypothetical protein